jgi:hypothetical protein
MELCSAVVRHAGNLGMTIHKERLPPAEVVLLRMVHGVDSVIGMSVTHTGARRDNAKEVQRLRELYGAKVFEEAFPGAMPQLPVTLAAANLTESMEVDAGDEPEDGDDDGNTVRAAPAPRPLVEDPADRVLPAPSAAVERARRSAASLTG